MTTLRPSGDGDPLPADTRVFRIGERANLNGEALHLRKASEIFFKPSSADEKSPGQRLSIWVEELTVADQGWSIMGCDPKKTIVACLDADAVSSVEPPEPFHSLSCEWERARLDDGSVNTHPGAEGHAGIAGLCQGSKKGREDKDRRKILRSKLADRAEISPVPVPHDLPEERLRMAAYFYNRNHAGCSCEEAWVGAVRQLRRERVLQERDEERD